MAAPSSLEIATKGLLDKGFFPTTELAVEGLLRDADTAGTGPPPGTAVDWLITARRRHGR